MTAIAAATSSVALSVVIPTLNEEKAAAECLRQFEPSSSLQVIVVDGGSTDRTLRIISTEFPWVTCVSAPTGRGTQINVGVRVALAPAVLLLHCDCTLPAGWAAAVEHALEGDEVVGGFFRLRTYSASRGRLFNALLRIADFRPNVLGQPYGDCGMFIRRSVFQRMGGVQPIPIMEDVDFAARMAEHGVVVQVPLSVTTSGRRFEAGVLRAAAVMMAFPWLFRCGVAPERLARWYRVIR